VKLSNLVISLAYGILVVAIIKTGINSDFLNYVSEFEALENIDSNWLDAIKGNVLITYLFYVTFSQTMNCSPYLTAYILYGCQAVLHGMLFLSLMPIRVALLFLFTDMQQIDLNQVRVGLALEVFCVLMLLAYRNNKNHGSSKMLLFTPVFLISTIMHFQVVYMIILSRYEKMKRVIPIILLITILAVASLNSLRDILIYYGVTERYLNQPTGGINNVLPLNLILYIPANARLLYIFSQFLAGNHGIGQREKDKYDGKVVYICFIVMIAAITASFGATTMNLIYLGRLHTGLYSCLLFSIALSGGLISRQLKTSGMSLNTWYKQNIGFIDMVMMGVIGVYRIITLSGNVWRII